MTAGKKLVTCKTGTGKGKTLLAGVETDLLLMGAG